MKIEKVPKHILRVLPQDLIIEMYNYEITCLKGEPTYVQKLKLCEISSSLKAIELAREYPQEYIDLLWDIYPVY